MKKMRLDILCTAALSVFALSACEEHRYDVDYPEHILQSGYEELELSWSEEFGYEGLPDTGIWGYEEGYAGNEELQDYRTADPAYSSVEDGVLTVRAVRDTHEGTVRFEFSSACLTTEGLKTFGTGRLDVMARIPTGRGLFPSISLLPADAEDRTTRIDLMHYVYGDADSRNRIYSTVSAEHLPDGFNINGGYASSGTLESSWHLYSVVIAEESLTFLFDNRTLYTLTKDEYGYEPWPFSQDFYLTLGVAVGGIYGGTWGVDTTIFPKQMEVDYIRYYKEKATQENN